MRVRDELKIQQVYRKAVELIVSEGLNGFSMQKLAKAAGVSPATLYIYYKDKDDLIVQLGIAEGRRMLEATVRDFDPGLPFAEGLRVQWRNRAAFWLDNPTSLRCLEHLRNSPYRDRIFDLIQQEFSGIMGRFMHNAISRGELNPMPLEVYWSVAFAPLMNLVKFHTDGRSVGNRPFVFSEAIMNQTLELVLKALKP